MKFFTMNWMATKESLEEVTRLGKRFENVQNNYLKWIELLMQMAAMEFVLEQEWVYC